MFEWMTTIVGNGLVWPLFIITYLFFILIVCPHGCLLLLVLVYDFFLLKSKMRKNSKTVKMTLVLCFFLLLATVNASKTSIQTFVCGSMDVKSILKILKVIHCLPTIPVIAVEQLHC